jgi:thioredoxin-like negative regulator of GroEL
MLEDHLGNPISTTSTNARDAYVKGVDLFLAASVGAEDAFLAAIDADQGFALPYAALARTRQTLARPAEAKETLALAQSLSAGVTEREAGQINILGLLISGKGPLAYQAARPHLVDYPRDLMVAQTCTGVFGLIGFSGLPGREAEHLALTTWLAPHYGDHWWFLTQHAFAQMECGQLSPAEESITKALQGNSKNANAAHYRAHLFYENAQTEAGYEFLTDWLSRYDKRGPLHCHLSWHCALWALTAGDIDSMWQIIDSHVAPGGAWGPPLNIVTDMTALLYRASIVGVDVSPERWQIVSEFATKSFPNPGVAFADTHAALAHAMAGNQDAVSKIKVAAKGAAGDLVSKLAEAFAAIGTGEWQGAIEHLTVAMRDHARIGGSRAQRDLIEFAMANALVQTGRADEARRLLSMRRPLIPAAQGILGL